MQEYLDVADLRKYLCPIPNVKFYRHLTDSINAVAELTEEEITAIDEAGAKGPPTFRRNCLKRAVLTLAGAGIFSFFLCATHNAYSWF